MQDYRHVAAAVFGSPWFIRDTEGALIHAIVRARVAGERPEAEEIALRIAEARDTQGPRGGQARAGSVAVVPIYGVIMPRATLMSAMSGGTSVAEIKAMMEDALRDEDVAAIIGEFDTPGGSVEGIEELATWIREQRGTKPMVAMVNTMAASAGYYIASQFDEIVASPSAMTGSIGVYTEHVESSEADAVAGIRTTVIRQPATKHEVNSTEPLPEEARAHLQSIVDDYYDQFIGAVAAGRGVSKDEVRKGYGQGRTLTSKRAKAAGLVDRIDTFEATVRRLSTGRGRAAARDRVGGATESVAVPSTNAVEAVWFYDSPAAPDPAPFQARLSSVSTAARELVEHARERADMRSKEGRTLTASDRAGLRAVADSLIAVAELDADGDPDDQPDAEPAEPDTARSLTPRRLVALELARADIG